MIKIELTNPTQDEIQMLVNMYAGRAAAVEARSVETINDAEYDGDDYDGVGIAAAELQPFVPTPPLSGDVEVVKLPEPPLLIGGVAVVKLPEPLAPAPPAPPAPVLTLVPPAPAPPVPLLTDLPVISQDVDINGTVWDAALHSAGKSKLEDGTWRLRRKSSAATKAPEDSDWATFIGRFSEGVTSGEISPASIQLALSNVGVNNVMQLMNRPDLREVVTHILWAAA